MPQWTTLLADRDVGLALAVLGALVAAWLVHRALHAAARRLLRKDSAAAELAESLRRPLALALPMLAIQVPLAARPTLGAWAVLAQIVLLGLIGGITWGAIALVGVTERRIVRQYRVDVRDNLTARRVHTQARVLARIVAVVIGIVGAAAALMTLPEMRHIGASLLASAGLAGLVAGFAARPVLSNLIAGLQIALAQPIRVDDVVIVEGEWGRVEEIGGTFVVIRIWDERRLVVPLSYFIEKPFQNWTRSNAELIGSVFLWTDYTVPVDAVRAELERACRESPEWDGRVCVLQVTDANERAIQLRALMSAPDSAKAWDLRCRMRERLVGFLQANYPGSLPRLRAELTPPAEASPPAQP